MLQGIDREKLSYFLVSSVSLNATCMVLFHITLFRTFCLILISLFTHFAEIENTN